MTNRNWIQYGNCKKYRNIKLAIGVIIFILQAKHNNSKQLNMSNQRKAARNWPGKQNAHWLAACVDKIEVCFRSTFLVVTNTSYCGVFLDNYR